MTKEQWGKVLSALIVCAVAVLGAFGYDVVVTQPRVEAQLAALNAPAGDDLGGMMASRSADYNTLCYREQGGAALVCDSGGLFRAVGTGTMQFEGATEDAYEGTFGVTDPTADRTWTLPNVSGTFMLTNTPGAIVLGTNTVTTTLTLSHGLTTPQTAFCTLLNDSEANGATCSATISGANVVIKLWKADGVTAGSVGKLISWMVGGQP